MNLVHIMAGGFGGGGDFIRSLNPVFYIKDLTVVQGGYFVDSSGNNKQIQAATTTITNDSLIMPANDADIISALTSAGCYSQYYADNSTPKKVLLSNISPCYNDYSYYNYFDKKNFTLFATDQNETNRSKILTLNNTHICFFNSVQTATPAQVSITYRCAVNKSAYVDYGNWGNQAIQKVNATNVDHTLASTGYQANTTYNIQMFTKKSDNGWTKFHCFTNGTLQNINSLSFVGMPLTYWQLYSSGTNHTIDSLHFVGMPLTTWVLYSSGYKNTIDSLHFVGMPLTTWVLYNSGNNHTINSSHFAGMSLTYWQLVNSGSKNIIDSLHFVGMPLTYWGLNNSGTNHTGTIGDLHTNITTITLESSGQGIGITSSLKEWAGATITLRSGYSTASVDGFIINWAAIAGMGAKTINLAGSNQPRSASDPAVIAAMTTLNSKGKTILTN